MRDACWFFVPIAVVAIVGCGSAALPTGGGDLAGADLAGRDATSSPPDFSGEDLSLRSCISQQCTTGVPCADGPHAGCCNQGEWCDNGTCRCGMGNACTAGKMCATGGPIMPGSECGTICCGAGTPCPL
jgi:hypothetical protein